MLWKTNPILLTQKLVKHIGENPKVSLDVLEARAVKHGVPMHVFDQAVTYLHKLKGVKRTALAHGVVRYELQAVEKKPDGVMSHVTWCRVNYPYPGKNGVPEFTMPFPEIDYSHIFLTPEQYQEYKAKLKGQVFIRKKRYEFKR